ncbi:MAG: dodecin family protein [Ignavibacteriaceae bacterium]|jgi:flavin-binding protein dodecin|nr:dodecin family protein [Ignavibacteriaceae bacterium]
MSKTFEVVELVGISTESLSDAVKQALESSGKEKPVSWFEIKEQRGRVTQDDKIEFQVTIKIGRKL